MRRLERTVTPPYVVAHCDDCGAEKDGGRYAWAWAKQHSETTGHETRVAVERIYRYKPKTARTP